VGGRVDGVANVADVANVLVEAFGGAGDKDTSIIFGEAGRSEPEVAEGQAAVMGVIVAHVGARMIDARIPRGL